MTHDENEPKRPQPDFEPSIVLVTWKEGVNDDINVICLVGYHVG